MMVERSEKLWSFSYIVPPQFSKVVVSFLPGDFIPPPYGGHLRNICVPLPSKGTRATICGQRGTINLQSNMMRRITYLFLLWYRNVSFGWPPSLLVIITISISHKKTKGSKKKKKEYKPACLMVKVVRTRIFNSVASFHSWIIYVNPCCCHFWLAVFLFMFMEFHTVCTRELRLMR